MFSSLLQTRIVAMCTLSLYGAADAAAVVVAVIAKALGVRCVVPIHSFILMGIASRKPNDCLSLIMKSAIQSRHIGEPIFRLATLSLGSSTIALCVSHFKCALCSKHTPITWDVRHSTYVQ